MRIPFQARTSTVRVSCGLVGVITSLLAAHSTFQIGFSRTLTERASKNMSVATATEAVKVSPKDPDSYRVRAIAFSKRREFGQAIQDVRQAISLRPADYGLWTQLGRNLDSNGETAAALVAYTEAHRLAPAFGSTCWDFGLQLVKLGRLDEGFAQLRNGVLRKPSLFPELMNLAWVKYDGEPTAFQRIISPHNDDERIELTRFLVKNAKPAESLFLDTLTESLSAGERRGIIREILAAKRFKDAYQLWRRDFGTSEQSDGTLEDGGFESGRLRDDEPFGWRIKKPQSTTISVSIDNAEAHLGLNSLRLEWSGNPSPSDEPVSQLLLVDPDTNYQLMFSARAHNLITGGAPVVLVTDVSGPDHQLARSQKLPLGDSEWRNFSVEFKAGLSTRAVRIEVSREACAQTPCPIYGTLRLDDFSLKQLEIR